MFLRTSDCCRNGGALFYFPVSPVSPEVAMVFRFLNVIIIPCILVGSLHSPCLSATNAGKKTSPQGKQPLVRTIDGLDSLKALISNAGDRLLMFDLYADWCMPCKILSPLLEKIAEEHKDKVTIYKINIDKNPQIAGAFGVSGIPFVVFVKKQQGVHALSGVHSKDTYIRAINQFAQSDAVPDITPDGELVEGIRVIRLATGTPPGNIYVYRGETVSLRIDKVEFPYSMSIPAFKIAKDGEPGKKFEVTFKAEDVGVYPIFCNGKCPTGNGAQYGRIVVMQYKASGEAGFSELSVEEAVKMIAEKKPYLLDVRTPNEYYSGHIPGARLIPVQQLEARISELADYKDKNILVYCRSGNRSTVASQILIKNGFKKLYNLRSGIRGWEAAGNKLVTE
jgi:thioredoxin